MASVSDEDDQQNVKKKADLQKRARQLISMIKYYQTQLDKLSSGNESIFQVTPDVTLEDLDKNIEDAEEYLIESRHNVQSQECAMQALQIKHVLSQDLEQGNSTSSHGKQITLKVLGDIENEGKKCAELGQEIDVMMKEVQAKQQERLVLSTELRRMKKRLQDVIEKRGEQRKQLDDKTLSEIKRLEKRIEIGQSRIKLAKLVFQELIIASQVNWQKDEQLSKLMEELGRK